MQTGNQRFHRLFRLAVPVLVVPALFPVPGNAQRAWGDADRILSGSAASAPMHPVGGSESPAPFNPASGAWSGDAVAFSVVMPMGVRDLSIYRTAGRIRVRGTAVSITAGRLGFDRLVQHRFSAGGARAIEIPKSDDTAAAVGFRATIDRFTSSGASASAQTAFTAGVLMRRTSTALGLVADRRPSGVDRAKAVEISSAVALRLGRVLTTSIGASQSTSRRPEVATAIRLDAAPGFAVMAAFGSGTSGPGVAAEVSHAGMRIRLAWFGTGPAGSTRLVSAMLETDRRGRSDE